MESAKCITDDQCVKLFGELPYDGKIVAYDIGCGDTENHPIKAYLDGENNWWFGCDNYDCIYGYDQLIDNSIVRIVEKKKTLREQLKLEQWENLKNNQNEIWNRTDLINGDESKWLDYPIIGRGDGYIIDCFGDMLVEA